jgi:protein-S-isoprenylcysteine O-methyltransferase Ste14
MRSSCFQSKYGCNSSCDLVNINEADYESQPQMGNGGACWAKWISESWERKTLVAQRISDMDIWKFVVRQAAKEYSTRARLLVIGFAAVVFVIVIPTGLFWISVRYGHLMCYEASSVISILGLFLAAMGLSLAIWTVYVQFKKARGTPAPFVATKKLLIEKPFSYCRNPMALGVFIYYLGIAVFTRSYFAILAVFLFIGCLILIIKLLEEKELEHRFGEEYLVYKQQTPFIIPRFGRFRRKL